MSTLSLNLWRAKVGFTVNKLSALGFELSAFIFMGGISNICVENVLSLAQDK
jgi:hypothetical protein